MQKFLFMGPDILLASHLAAFASLDSLDSVCLLLSNHDSCAGDQVRTCIRQIMQQSHQGNAPEKDCDNLIVMAANSDDPSEMASIIEGFEADQVWFTGVPSADSGTTGFDSLFSILSGPRIACLSFVAPSLPRLAMDGKPLPFPIPQAAADIRIQQEFEQALFEKCQSGGISCKLFHLPLLLGEHLPSLKCLGHPLVLFLAELHQIKREIEARLSDYFEYQSLRCWAPANAHLSLMHFREAARTLLAIASDPNSKAGIYQIADREAVPFDQFCEWAGRAYDLNLLSMEDTDELNAIDRLFSGRVATLNRFFNSSAQTQLQKDQELVLAVSGFRKEEFALAELKSIRRLQSAEVDRKLARVAAFSSELQHKTLHVNGAELTYFTAGSQGPPVVLLNALGQGLRYWHRLMGELSQEHKIITWELRGTISAPQPVSLSEQVDDLDATLTHEGIETCHLVAWCTGPKVALEFYLRRPRAVASMVFLNAAFRCTNTPRHLITEYESNLEPLFRALDRRPGMAPAVMKALRQSAADAELPSLSEMDSKELALRVLSLMSRDLQPEIIYPFRSEASTLNYARQVLDFYSCEVASQAPNVNVPVLLIGAEYDKIASPQFSRNVAQAFPLGRYVELSGATHYCLHEQSGRVFDLIRAFFKESESSGQALPLSQAAPVSEFSKERGT